MSTDSYMDIFTGNSDANRVNAKELNYITKRKIDVANAYLKYIGEAGPSALTSDASWRIRREITQGNLTTISYASPKFDKVWDDRATLVYESGAVVSPFNNTLSTDFDGINDYVSMGDAFNYDISQQFSVSIWVKPNNLSALRYFIGNISNDVSVNGWRIGHDATGKIITQTRSGGATYAPTTFTDSTLVAGVWNHIVFTWNGGSNNNSGRIYLNGVLSAITGSTTPLVSSWLSANVLEIGRAYTNYFSGRIDEVSMWNKALSNSEVSELFNAGEPADPSASTMSANLKNWYRMGDGDTYPTIINNAGASENGTMINMTAGSFVLDVP